jgi:hypothetical protein
MSDPNSLEFCDLSSELDRSLSFLARFSGNLSPLQDADLHEGYSEFIWDYLGKRAALEHVFWGRYLGTTEWDTLKLKAEVWRIRKIRATIALKTKSEKQTNRSE